MFRRVVLSSSRLRWEPLERQDYNADVLLRLTMPNVQLSQR